jgi:hypothetical protein
VRRILILTIFLLLSANELARSIPKTAFSCNRKKDKRKLMEIGTRGNAYGAHGKQQSLHPAEIAEQAEDGKQITAT